jgi:thiol-disulfide isomerase/thioredoxin
MNLLKKVFAPLALIGLLVLLGYSSLHKAEAPNASFTTIEGKTFNMASLKGKVVLVNFWATDCKSCVEEMPELIQTYKTYADKGFELIAVAMPYDPPAQVANFTKQKNLPFPVMHDGYAEISQQFGGVNGTPTTYLYDKDGKRIQHTVGTLDFKKLHALLDKELS